MELINTSLKQSVRKQGPVLGGTDTLHWTALQILCTAHFALVWYLPLTPCTGQHCGYFVLHTCTPYTGLIPSTDTLHCRYFAFHNKDLFHCTTRTLTQCRAHHDCTVLHCLSVTRLKWLAAAFGSHLTWLPSLEDCHRQTCNGKKLQTTLIIFSRATAMKMFSIWVEYTGCFFYWYPPKKLKYGKPR